MEPFLGTWHFGALSLGISDKLGEGQGQGTWHVTCVLEDMLLSMELRDILCTPMPPVNLFSWHGKEVPNHIQVDVQISVVPPGPPQENPGEKD